MAVKKFAWNQLAAEQGTLASGRNQIYVPKSGRRQETAFEQNLDIKAVISQANGRETKRARAETRRSRPLWERVLNTISFGWFKLGTESKKDYTYEFDPKTGGQRRVYKLI